MRLRSLQKPGKDLVKFCENLCRIASTFCHVLGHSGNLDSCEFPKSTGELVLQELSVPGTDFCTASTST